LEKIQEWYWEKDTWSDKYILLQEYIKEYNKIPKCDEIYKDIKIGKFISHQREYYKKNILDNERIKKLEEINKWLWEKIDTWSDNYELLINFVKENNRIPSSIEKYKDIKIGS